LSTKKFTFFAAPERCQSVETNRYAVVSMATEASPADRGRVNFLKMGVYVDVLHSQSAKKLYVGQTEDPVKRLNRHNAGLELYTASHRPWNLNWCITKPSRAEAMVLEKKLKNLSRNRLELFMDKYVDGLAMAKRLGTSPHIK
jgi:putative endonuclease